MADESKAGLLAKIKEALHQRSLFGKLAEVADRRRHTFRERVLAQRKVGDHLQARYERAVDNGQIHMAESLLLELKKARRKEERLHSKLEFWRNRFTWANERHEHWSLVWKHRKDRLTAWIKQHQTFQPYMANGNPYEKLTAEARYAIYLDFKAGLYVTSTYEGYRGDGVHTFTSNHYIENSPDGKARCWDAASSSRSKMVAAQRREAARCPSYLREMIGPQNDCEYSNGVRYTLPEGDALENMHDNHKHQAINDGAPTS